MAGIVAVLVFEVKQWLGGNTTHTLKDSLILEPANDGLVNPRFGFSHMGVMSQDMADKHMPSVHDVINNLEPKVKASEEYRSLEKTHAEIAHLKRKLREELAVIRLKRIVPGRCKYCPL